MAMHPPPIYEFVNPCPADCGYEIKLNMKHVHTTVVMPATALVHEFNMAWHYMFIHIITYHLEWLMNVRRKHVSYADVTVEPVPLDHMN